MIWHVHLEPNVSLDLHDGRSIPLAVPPPTHQWRLPDGRLIDVAHDAADQLPTGDMVTIRVLGGYVRVTLAADRDRRLTVTATAFGDPRGPSELRADLAGGWSAVEAAIRQAVDLASGSRPGEPPTTLAYGPGAWQSHEPTWLRTSSEQTSSEQTSSKQTSSKQTRR